jgi:hypothetical protein
MLAAIDGNFAGLMLVLLVMAVVIPIAIVSFIFWIWMLISAVQNKGLGEGEKIAWVLIIVLLHWLGALLYLVVGFPKRKSPLLTPPKT